MSVCISQLRRIFAAYGGMDVSVQETIQQLITPLVRALGSTHGKLLTLLRTFPPGADSLALRVLSIFTETGRPSGQLVALVKSLVNERDLDARFLIPIIAEMDKVSRVPFEQYHLECAHHCLAGGHPATPPADRVHSQRHTGAQEPRALRV